MLLLSCTQLSRGFDDEPLFRNLGFELYAGQRAGLVGPNGVGKTTLLRLLADLDHPDTGSVRCHAGARIALLQQQPIWETGRSLLAEAKSALDVLLAAQEDLIQTAETLAKTTDEAERKTLTQRYERLNDLLHHHDAYHVDHRVAGVLQGLGFDRADFDRSVETFSGGQQSRLMLAKLLLSAPDIMLLDEPNNHLDIEATQWLEDYLVKQSAAMLIVSHDRYFLNKVVNKVFEMHAGKITSYPGNFDDYCRLREERYELAVKEWQAQQEYIDKQEEYIRRVHYGQLHKQAQSRQKALDRIDRVERPTLIETPQMHFSTVRRSGDVVLRCQDLSKAYDQPLFTDLNFSLERGKRLGILGPNGSGKTTLLRCLLGEEEADSGIAEQGYLVQFGYYDQHLESLDVEKDVMNAVWPDENTPINQQALRDVLARFGLVGEQVNQQVGRLSGGERSRAALARLVMQGVNVLVLDEPTNHLDLWACNALEKALMDFEGSVVVVSHDRYFLNRVVDMLIALDGKGGVHVVHGNYDTLERMRAIRKTERTANKKSEPASRTVTVTKPQKRKRKFPYRKVEDLERDIAAEESRLQDLEKQLASSELYQDGDRVKQTMDQFEQTKVTLAQLYDHWEEAVELN